MLTFLDPVEPLDVDWSRWSELARAQPRWVAQISGPEVNGHDAPRRFGAVFVAPARVVCGLRAWDDAVEGVDSSGPWVAYEAEKIVRMMLHQSGLAFEILASSRVSTEDFPARRIAEAAVTRQIVGYYRDIARSMVADAARAAELWRWRSALTGLALAHHGVVSTRLETLLEVLSDSALKPLGEGEPPVRQSAAKLIEALDDFGTILPEQPADYEWLDEWVAAERLGTTA